MPIRPIDAETTLNWMVGFSDELSPGRTRATLLDALKRPAYYDSDKNGLVGTNGCS